MSTKIAPYKKDYVWALNKIKLNEAITDLEVMRESDKTIEITEESIKMRYIVRKGSVLKSEADLEEEARIARLKKVADARALIAETEAEEENLVKSKKASKKETKAEEKEEAKEE